MKLSKLLFVSIASVLIIGSSCSTTFIQKSNKSFNNKQYSAALVFAAAAYNNREVTKKYFYDTIKDYEKKLGRTLYLHRHIKTASNASAYFAADIIKQNGSSNNSSARLYLKISNQYLKLYQEMKKAGNDENPIFNKEILFICF